MKYSLLLDAIMSSNKHIRFSLVSDMYGNIIISRLREGHTNLLSSNETKETLQLSIGAWRRRIDQFEKIGKARYALVEYEKISRISLLLSDERMLVVSVDTTKNPLKIINPILKIVVDPKFIQT
ncbi:MAG TPA: hypothetical protein VD731_02270 [Nitrosopumilaceae archaeon]|nr:hypothetical protein [Nitrosopumilaceae archaeon]